MTISIASGASVISPDGDVHVQENGTPIGAQNTLNFVEGTNVSLDIAEDQANQRIDITINAAGGGGGGDVTGTTSSLDNAIVRYSGTSGKLIQTSSAVIDDNGNVTFSGTVTGSGLSGVNTGDQTITLTGDVSGTGTGTFTTTITNSAVTFAKIQQIAATSLIGNSATSTGTVAAIAVSTGLAFSGNLIYNTITQYTNSAAIAAITGMLQDTASIDFSSTATTITASVKTNAISYALFQQIGAGSLVGNSATSTGNAETITVGTGLSISSSAIVCTITQYTNSAAIAAVTSVLQASSSITWSTSTSIFANVVNNTTTQKVVVSQSGVAIGTRKQINFLTGTSVNIIASDSAGGDLVNVSITATGTLPGFNSFVISPQLAPTLTSSSLVIALSGGSAVVNGFGIPLPALTPTLTSSSIYDAWLNQDGTWTEETESLSTYIDLPHYTDKLHVWRISTGNNYITAVNLMGNANWPTVYRPSDIAGTIDTFAELFYLLPTTTNWTASTTVTYGQLLTAPNGNVYQVYTPGVTGTSAPTSTAVGTITNGSAGLFYYSQSSYLGMFRYAPNNGVEYYFTNQGLESVVHKELVTGSPLGEAAGTTVASMVKNHLLGTFKHVIGERVNLGTYAFGMKAIAGGYIWLNTTTAGGTASSGSPFTGTYTPGTSTVLDGTITWLCTYTSYTSTGGDRQKWFWMNVDRTFLTYRSPDSHDSYASTFASLLSRYIQLTDDYSWLSGNSPQPSGSGTYWTYAQVFGYIMNQNLDIQISNFLTKTFQYDVNPLDGSTFTTQYLEDNCESVKGYKNAAYIYGVLGDTSAQVAASSNEDYIGSGVAALYDSNYNLFATNYGQTVSSWATNTQIGWYPYLQAQFFPELCNVPTINDDQFKLVRYNVSQRWPNYFDDRGIDVFANNFLGLMAAKSWQDTKKAYDFVEKTERYFITGGSASQSSLTPADGTTIAEWGWYLGTKDALVAPLTILNVYGSTLNLLNQTGDIISIDFTSSNPGTVTSIATGTGLTGGPVTTAGTIYIPNLGITTALLDTSGVTYAKIQNVSTGQRILANTATSAGAVAEATLSQILDFAGTATGNILYRGSTAWAALAPSTTGYTLQTQGSTSNPVWAQVSLTAGVTGILTATNGGTGNAFFLVSGPTTTTRTYTFPNASATVLTDNATVTVPQGGTGVTTIAANKLIKGNTTSPVAVTNIDVDSNDGISGYYGVRNAYSATSVTLSNVADAGKIAIFTATSAITLTLPNNTTTSFCCSIFQAASSITFTTTGSATLRNRSSHNKTAGQYAMATLFVATNSGGSAAEWVLAGDTST